MLEQSPPKKIVLAYSGGLDTSVILPWLKERYPGVKLVAFAAELGQGNELKGIEDKAYKSGADEVVVMDLRQEFAEQYCFPMLRAHAIYEQDYLLGTSIARPLIAAKQVEVARQTNADAVGHGATGKGNDQVRFELTYLALAPDLKIIAPWKDTQFELRDRESAVDYAQKHGIPIPVSKKKIYSQDRNLWHISHEGAEIEHPDAEPNWEACLTTVVPPEKAPNEAEIVSIEFERGNPIGVNGNKPAVYTRRPAAPFCTRPTKLWNRFASSVTRCIISSKWLCGTPSWCITASGSIRCVKVCRRLSITPTPPFPATPRCGCTRAGRCRLERRVPTRCTIRSSPVSAWKVMT